MRAKPRLSARRRLPLQRGLGFEAEEWRSSEVVSTLITDTLQRGLGFEAEEWALMQLVCDDINELQRGLGVEAEE